LITIQIDICCDYTSYLRSSFHIMYINMLILRPLIQLFICFNPNISSTSSLHNAYKCLTFYVICLLKPITTFSSSGVVAQLKKNPIIGNKGVVNEAFNKPTQDENMPPSSPTHTNDSLPSSSQPSTTTTTTTTSLENSTTQPEV